ncbi:MAG: hypothetical protein H6963_09800 [Chromatiaceae bacterium]|nr:hypothetical protein [Chromatiaceae bacterium]
MQPNDFIENIAGSIPAASTNFKTQTRPLTASGYWAGFCFYAYCRRPAPFQEVVAAATVAFFKEIHHTALLFRLKILRILTPIHRTSSGALQLNLQALLHDLVDKLVDTLLGSVKQIVDVYGRSLLVFVYAFTYGAVLNLSGFPRILSCTAHSRCHIDE